MTLGCRLSVVSLLASALYAQPPSLAFSRTIAGADRTGVLELSFAPAPESPIAALQWTLQYPADAVAILTVEDGPATTLAGKSVFCLSDSDVSKCVVAGSNADMIAGGVVARITLKLAPNATEANIRFADTLGASPVGQPVTVRGKPGKISTSGDSVRGSASPPSRSMTPKQ